MRSFFWFLFMRRCLVPLPGGYKKIYTPIPCTAVRDNTAHRREMYYCLPSRWALAHRFSGAMMMLLLSCGAGSWFLDVVLNFCSWTHRTKKRHPCLKQSDWQRLALSSLTALSTFGSVKASLCSYLGHSRISAHTPHLEIWGWNESSFTFVVVVWKKGLAHDIASQSVMVIPLTLVRSITTPGCQTIFHVALLDLPRCPF
jgi:hypothetical protein